MRSTITLNGINSNTIEGLLIQKLPPISKPLMRTQIEEIDGRDGDVITKLGFSAYNKEITIGLYGDFDINQIIQYFTSQGTVVFSNEPDKYYYYQIIDQIDFERLIRYRTATVTMHCQPFKYSTTEGTQVFDNSSNLLTIPNSTTTTNGVTVTANNNILTISGTASAATEFYIPIDTLSLSVGKYGMYALGSGTNPEACSLRLIYNSPSNANSFGGNYVTLKNNQTVSLIANLSNAKTYNYVYLYIAANKAMDFTLNLSIEDAAQSVVTGEGNLITLEGTAFAPFDKFDLKGDTTQQTYSGKNLFNKDASATTSSASTSSSTLPTGVRVTQSVSSSTGDYRYVLYVIGNTSDYVGKTLTLSSNMSASGTNIPQVIMGICNANGSSVTGIVASTSSPATISKSFTQTDADNRPKICVGFYSNAGAAAEANSYADFTNVQLELGSATSYEPFVGGTASPNPDYPQTVNNVTGRQVVTVTDGGSQSQSYEVNLGKNLFDGTYLQSAVGGANNDHWLVGNNLRSAIIPCEPNTTYTATKSDSSDRFLFADNPTIPTTNNQSINYLGGNNSASSYTVTTHSDAHYLIVYVSASSQEPRLQIELGSQSTSYSTYFTPIELCKIGTYQDYIYKSGSDWYVHKEIEKVVYDGSEIGWATGLDGTTRQFYRTLDSAGSATGGYSDKFAYNAAIGILNTFFISSISQSVFQNPTSNGSLVASTVSEWTTWLASNNVTVYYALATSTDTQITDSSVVAQLEALVTDAHAYKNTTTLVSTSENMPHIMSVEVAKNNDATITNSGNTTAKPVMTVYGSGTVGIYLNGNQIFNVNIGNNQYITIDTANMEAYKDTTDNLMNRLVDGDYSNFVLQTGENQISFSGSVSKLEISNYSRWI